MMGKRDLNLDFAEVRSVLEGTLDRGAMHRLFNYVRTAWSLDEQKAQDMWLPYLRHKLPQRGCDDINDAYSVDSIPLPGLLDGQLHVHLNQIEHAIKYNHGWLELVGGLYCYDKYKRSRIDIDAIEACTALSNVHTFKSSHRSKVLPLLALPQFENLTSLQITQKDGLTIDAFNPYTPQSRLLTLSLKKNGFRNITKNLLEFWSLENIRHLDLSYNPLREEDCMALMHDETFMDIETLNLAGCALFPKHFEHFLASYVLPRPKHLDWSYNPWLQNVPDGLFNAALFEQIESLNVSTQFDSSRLASTLQNASLPHLKSLSIVTANYSRHLSQQIARFPFLDTLEKLTVCYIYNDDPLREACDRHRIDLITNH